MIIVLIAVEVGFEVNRLWKEREERWKVARQEGVTEKKKKQKGFKEAGNGVVAVEMLAPNAASVAEGIRTKESGEMDVDNLRRELEEMVERQRELLNALEMMDKNKNGQTVSSTLASSSQSSSPEPTSQAEQPIQAYSLQNNHHPRLTRLYSTFMCPRRPHFIFGICTFR